MPISILVVVLEVWEHGSEMIENDTTMITLETDHIGLKTSLADTMKQEVYTAQDIMFETACHKQQDKIKQNTTTQN